MPPNLVAFAWDLTKETINLPLGCLQGGVDRHLVWPRPVPTLVGKPRRLALFQSISAHCFRGPGLFFGPKLTGLHRETRLSTLRKAVDLTEAELDRVLQPFRAERPRPSQEGTSSRV